MCDCYSYNGAIGTVPEVVLPRPGFLPEGVRVNGVPVDACIANVVQHLWDNGVTTLGSCCGHNGQRPNSPYGAHPQIILGETERDYARIYQLIADVDNREWKLLQWQLVAVML